MEESNDEQNDQNAVNDEITEHLPRVALQRWRKLCDKNSMEFHSSTYALNGEQQLIGEVEINKQDENSDDATDNRSTSTDTGREEGAVVSSSE